MKRVALAAVIVLALAAPVQAKAPGFRAQVHLTLPEVQHVGTSYIVHLTVKRTGQAWIPRFCVDFGDSDNSWKIIMPGMKAYDDDVYCYGTLKPKTKQFYARLVPAKAGQKKLEVCFGSAAIHNDVNRADLGADALCWSDTFVLT